MRLTILTIGSRGDVQPYIALGRGLQSAGFQVRLATHAPFRDFVEGYGLDFFPLAGDPQGMLDSPDGRAWLDSDQNGFQFLKYFVKMAKPWLNQSFADSLEACQDADGIIYSMLGFTGYHIAEKLGVQPIRTYLQPFGRTRDFVSIGAKPEISPTGWSNYISHVVTEQALWQPFRTLVNQARREHLDLPPAPFWGPFGTMEHQQQPMILGYSPSVVPKPSDWPDWYHVAGYWFAPEPENWQPSAELVAFLAQEPKPLYIGFGSMSDRDPAKLTQMVVEALEQTDQRAILLSGWAKLHREELPDSVLVVDSVPHSWLFPQVTAVVHHGGAGTTAAGLRAGVPNILVPYFADQHFWGYRVADLGVGPTAVPRAKLTADLLAKAIREAVYNRSMQARAANLGEKIRAEDGVATAVATIQSILKT